MKYRILEMFKKPNDFCELRSECAYHLDEKLEDINSTKIRTPDPVPTTIVEPGSTQIFTVQEISILS